MPFLQIPAGLLVDRYGVKFPYALSFFAWSLMSAGTALGATSVQSDLVLRFFLGVGESVVTPASLRWIRFHFAEKQRGLALGLYITGTKIGPAIGAVDGRQADSGSWLEGDVSVARHWDLCSG